MSLLRRLSVGQRQAWLAALSIAAMALCVVVGIGVADKLGMHARRMAMAKDLVADILPPPMYLVELRQVLSQAHEGTLPRARALEETNRLANEYAQRMKHWEAQLPPGVEHGLMAEQHRRAMQFIHQVRQWLALPEDAPPALRRTALEAAHQTFLPHRAEVHKSVTRGNQVAEAEITAFEGASGQAQQMLVSILVLGPSCLLLMSWLTVRSIVRPLRRSVDLAQAMAGGDLTQEIASEGGDEPAQLMAALNAMRASQVDLVRKVRANGHSVSESTERLMSSSETLIARSEHNRAELKTTGFALKEVTALVEANARAAESAPRPAAARQAPRGG